MTRYEALEDELGAGLDRSEGAAVARRVRVCGGRDRGAIPGVALWHRGRAGGDGRRPGDRDWLRRLRRPTRASGSPPPPAPGRHAEWRPRRRLLAGPPLAALASPLPVALILLPDAISDS